MHVPHLLFVDDRPTSLRASLLQRTDVEVTMLGVGAAGDAIGHDEKRFVLDPARPIEEEAARFRAWENARGARVDSFLNPSEPLQELTHRFARALGLPALSEEAAKWSRNKPLMKRRFRELGFETAAYAEVSTKDDIRAFALRHGWPLVLKPQDGFACLDTHLLRGPSDLDGVSLGDAWRWMIESFVPHREYECCALVEDGYVLDTYLSLLPAPVLDAVDGAINGSISMPEPPRGFGVDMREVFQRLADGFFVERGYMHINFFKTPDGVVLCELALRIAGIETPITHGLSRGFSMHDALIDISIGRSVRLDYSQHRFVGEVLLPSVGGRVVSHTPKQELLAMPGVLTATLKVAPGVVVEPRRACHVASGSVHVEGRTAQEVEDRMRSVLDAFRIVTAPATETCDAAE